VENGIILSSDLKLDNLPKDLFPILFEFFQKQGISTFFSILRDAVSSWDSERKNMSKIWTLFLDEITCFSQLEGFTIDLLKNEKIFLTLFQLYSYPTCKTAAQRQDIQNFLSQHEQVVID
jgi:hypothetical protein